MSYSRKVLICDDQPMLRSLLACAVQDSWPNSEVVEAKDGAEGEELARENDFDVIFLDVEMPKQNGFQTLRHIREEGIAMDTPIVMVTGCMGESVLSRGWRSEVDYYIRKPFDVDTIDRVLDEIKWRKYAQI